MPFVFTESGHFEYPVSKLDRHGSHLDAFFMLEPLINNKDFLDCLSADIKAWIEREKIEFDLFFAPAQPVVMWLIKHLANELNKDCAFLEYDYQTGWFGTQIVEGIVKLEDRTIVFNGVSQTGKCVGISLPAVVEKAGAKVVAAGIFARGNSPSVRDTQEKYGSLLYTCMEAEVEIYPPDSCPLCLSKQALSPWTALRDNLKKQSGKIKQ
jgi:hypothetical protein